MDQFAGVADYIDLIKTDLPGLYSMFNESLPEEVLKIATDLDMTGAQRDGTSLPQTPARSPQRPSSRAIPRQRRRQHSNPK